MKRVLSALIALVLVCIMTFSSAPAEETILAFPMEGVFFSSLWGGTPYDAMVRRLLNGLSPVYWDEEHLRYRQDDAVAEEILVTDTSDGGREYLISFRQDMCFSDGSPVTAGDYDGRLARDTHVDNGRGAERGKACSSVRAACLAKRLDKGRT